MVGKRVYFESYGCPSNKFDMKAMIITLKKSGHIVAERPESADILVINTCGVKTVTEDKILDRLRSLRSLNKPIVVAGCLPKIDQNAVTKAVPDYLALLDPFSIRKISDAIKGYERGRRSQHFFSDENEAGVKIEKPNLSKGEILEIVPIAEGA